MSVQELIDVTRRYGGNPDYVLAGGGNTSLKEDGVMYVKASGSSMGDIEEKGFVKMDQKALDALWTADYPDNEDEREELVLEDLMKARLEGESARPSVETLLHSFIPFTYVVHTHPALVNGLTCSVGGQEWAEKALGNKALWIPVVNPGYILAKYVKDRVDEHMAKGLDFPDYIILQNHGVFTGGNTIAEVDQRYQLLMGKLEEAIRITPDMAEESLSGRDADVLKAAVREVYGAEAGFEFISIKECSSWLASREAAAPVFSALTPDHIVYMGHEPLWIPSSGDQASALKAGVASYEAEHGKKPKTLLVQNRGIVSCGDSEKVAHLSGLLFRDAVKVSVFAGNFGGVQFMPQDKIDFINNWEVEKYRAKQSS